MPIISNQWFMAIPICLGLICLIIFGKRRGKITVLLISLTVTLTDFTSARLLKPTFKRIRPSRNVENVRLLGGKGGKYGFPSNHVANYTAGSVILGFFYHKTFLFTWILIFAVAYSRIYLGVHYPLDTIGGFIFGLLMAFIIIWGWLALDNHLRKKNVYKLSIITKGSR